MKNFKKKRKTQRQIYAAIITEGLAQQMALAETANITTKHTLSWKLINKTIDKKKKNSITITEYNQRI